MSRSGDRRSGQEWYRRRTTRRTILAGAGSLGLVNQMRAMGDDVGDRVGTSQSQSSGTWPQYQHDAANTGYAPTNNGPKTAIETRWEFAPVGGGTTSPAVADGTVFVSYDVQNERGGVTAIDTVSGEEQWTVEFDDTQQWSSPTVVDETVYVGTGDGSIERETASMYALDAATGDEQWHFETGGNVTSSPTVADGTVYFGTQSGDLSCYALDASDGEQQWRTSIGSPIHATPVVVGDKVYIIGSGLQALAADGGSLRWSAAGHFEDLDASFQGSAPAVSDGTIYVGSRAGVVDGEFVEADDSGSAAGIYALDPGQQQVQWVFETDGEVQSSPAVTDELVVAGCRDPDGHVYGIDAESGEERWRFEVGDIRFQSPVIAGETVYVGEGTLYALDITTGQMRWERSDVHSRMSFAVADETIYVCSQRSAVYAIEGTATEEIEQHSGGSTTTAPSITQTTETGGVSVFERFSDEFSLPIALGGGGVLSAVGLGAYRWLDGEGGK